MTRSGKDAWLYWIVPAAACMVVLVLVICISIAAATSLHAERSLHAMILAVDLTENFVREKGRWPNSWDELSVVEEVTSPSMSSWPQDLDTLKQLVQIDFWTDLEIVARQTAETFDKIQPTGSCYPLNDYACVTRLLRTANEVVKAQLHLFAQVVIDAEVYDEWHSISRNSSGGCCSSF